MDEYNKLALLYFDCLVVKVLLSRSRRLIEKKDDKQESELTQNLVVFVTEKIQARDRPKILRRLVDFNLVALAISLLKSNSDTLTLLNLLESTKERLILRSKEFADIRALLIDSGRHDSIYLEVTRSDVEDLEKKCQSLLARPDLEEPLQAWTAYLNFYRRRVSPSTGLFEERIMEMLDSDPVGVATSFFRALEDDGINRNCLKGLFSTPFLMTLMSKAIN